MHSSKDRVTLRLLGALQTDSHTVTPTSIHGGELWETNIGIDKQTGEIVIFGPGSSIYAHNEMEFGTWRYTWPFQFNDPIYLQRYTGQIKSSKVIEE